MDKSDLYSDDDYEFTTEASTLQLSGFPSQLLITGFHPINKDLPRVFVRSSIMFDREGDASYAIYYADPSPMYKQGGACLTVFND